MSRLCIHHSDGKHESRAGTRSPSPHLGLWPQEIESQERFSTYGWGASIQSSVEYLDSKGFETSVVERSSFSNSVCLSSPTILSSTLIHLSRNLSLNRSILLWSLLDWTPLSYILWPPSTWSQYLLTQPRSFVHLNTSHELLNLVTSSTCIKNGKRVRGSLWRVASSVVNIPVVKQIRLIWIIV